MKAWLAFLLFMLSIGMPAIAEQQLQYEPSVVQLSGTVITRMYYGPPNFGEDPKTDRKVYPFILKLDHPVTVLASTIPCGKTSDCDTYTGVREIELVAFTSAQATELKQLMGHHITVKGQLYDRFDALQNTDVLMDFLVFLHTK